MNDNTLAALSIERRTLSLALFTDNHLDEMVVRHLPVELKKASSSVVGFLNSSFDSRHIEFIALLQPHVPKSLRAELLYRSAIEAIRFAGIPLIEVGEKQLLDSYACKPLRRKEQLRRIARTIWPSLNTARASHSSLDAALVGLYTQVDRLFTAREVLL